jgi:Fe2+ or Zn2+ uptake regulation protein
LKVITCLQEVNLRPTHQRISLAKVLLEVRGRHITANVALGSVGLNIRVSLAAGYNTMNQVTIAGLLPEISIDSQHSYLDTNTLEHRTFFFEKTNHLGDIKSEDIVLNSIPKMPRGTVFKRIDIVIMLNSILLSVS